ncbi:MAG TPA: NAD(P)-dependent oxidoreductase, partial [Chitinispirillaceae bacterium]|nr:NAD(P)-dependent oxidoreductase [Chitinispirillaceae bacterium]
MNIGKNYYPVMLKLENSKCLLIGGGKIAQRKLEKLLESGAIVTIVSPDVTSGIEKLCNEEKVSWIVDTYKSCYL